VHQHLEIQAKLQRYSQAQLRPQQGGDSRKFQGYLRGYPASGTRGNVLPNSGSGSGGITLGAINLEHASSGHHHGGRGGGGGGNGGGGVGLVESAPSAPLMAGGAEDLDRSLGGSLGWGISHPLRAMTGQPASASQQQPYSALRELNRRPLRRATTTQLSTDARHLVDSSRGICRNIASSNGICRKITSSNGICRKRRLPRSEPRKTGFPARRRRTRWLQSRRQLLSWREA
jgi:hypothetical protein